MTAIALEGTALRDFADEMFDDRNIPVRLPQALRRGVRFALGASAVGLPVWALIGEPVASIFVPVSLTSLLMAGTVLMASSGFTRPVPINFHKVAWLSVIPASINVLALGLGTILGVIAVAIAIAVAIFALFIFFGALSAALSS